MKWKCRSKILCYGACLKNHYARFNIINITAAESRLNVNSVSQLSVKCRSKALGHGVCLKNMLRTMSMQGCTLAAITGVEKHTSFRFVFCLTSQ